jgi:rare lipoprotein A
LSPIDNDRLSRALFLCALLLGSLGLSGCYLPGNSLLGANTKSDGSLPPDPVPRHEPLSKLGNMPSYVVFGKRYYTLKTAAGYAERGIASWYGPQFHGKKTSSGEPYNMNAMTAAHPTLPLPTYVRVTNLETGQNAVVRVNDRGPFKKNRVIDLSKAAATKLGIIAKGTGLVEVRAITPGASETAAPAHHPIRGDIYIQVGAYGEQANAEQMRQRIGQLGQPVRIVPPATGERPLFRVQVGPYHSVEQTDIQAARIMAMGIETYIVIQ